MKAHKIFIEQPTSADEQQQRYQHPMTTATAQACANIAFTKCSTAILH